MCLSAISNSLNIIEKTKNFFCFIFKRKGKHKEEDEENYKTNNFPYYFKDYTKHITVYKNGNGIIINSSTLVVTDIKRFKKIYRKLNIEDGSKNAKFPSLIEMMKTNKEDRYKKFGFWYYSENDIIKSVEEFYWSDTNKSKEDKRLKVNHKELRWTFDFNNGKIKEGKPYYIVYVISIIGMYPIVNGKIVESLINDPNSKDENSSEMDIIQDIENFKYIVSFEDGIDLTIQPKCELCNQEHTDNDNEILSEEVDYNTLYKKYNFKVTKPILGSKIKVDWKFNS